MHVSGTSRRPLAPRDALRRDTSLGSVANFSSQISQTMKQQAIVALVLSLLAVVLYIWVRFGSLQYGLAAIAALVHDVTITKEAPNYSTRR